MGTKGSKAKEAKAKKGTSLKDLKPKRGEAVKGGAEPVGTKLTTRTTRPLEPVNG